MKASVKTRLLHWLEAVDAVVSAEASPGAGGFDAEGLRDVERREVAVCVLSALATVGVRLDGVDVAVTVEKAAGTPWQPGGYLAVAVAVLGAMGRLHIEGGRMMPTVIGDLELSGRIRAVRGIYPMLVGAVGEVIVPAENTAEAEIAGPSNGFGASDLAEVIAHLTGRETLPRIVARPPVGAADDSEILGTPVHPGTLRGMVVAAAGGHGIAVVGRTGGCSAALARSFVGLLPEPGSAEIRDVTAIHSIAGLVDPAVGFVRSRPFRAPHHTVSDAGLVGGGTLTLPGELSLAHHGVLCLHELPEFRQSALVAVRDAVLRGEVRLSRGGIGGALPTGAHVFATLDACPCGYYGSPARGCPCTPAGIKAYLGRPFAALSEVLQVRVDTGAGGRPVEISTRELRERVTEARDRQAQRMVDHTVNSPTNARLTMGELASVAGLDAAAAELMATNGHRSPELVTNALRVARTVADLASSDRVRLSDVVEAWSLCQIGGAL